jgi:hypothetical protein
MPEYIEILNISPASKQQARNVHISIVNELMNLTNKEGYKIFVNDNVLELSVIAINPIINNEEALDIANKKINQLNGLYNNSIRLIDSINKKFLVINTTEFANEIENGRNQYADEYLKDNGKFFNLEAHAEQKIDDSSINNSIAFLKKLGVNVEAVVETGIGGKALANILSKTVNYVFGYENKLPEEAAHFLTNLLPDNHPVMVKALQNIVNYPIYNEVVREYGERYNYNELKLKHEAIGKIIAERVKNYKGRIEETNSNDEPISWIKAIIKWFREKFLEKRQEDNEFDTLAEKIINGDVSDLSFENVQNEVIADGIFLYESKYESMMEKYNNMSTNKQKELTKEIRSMFSNLSALKKSINEMEITLSTSSKTMFDKTLQFLKSAVYNVENTSISSVNTFIELAVQTELMLKDFNNETEAISEIADPNLKLFKLYHFNRSTDLLIKSIVPQLTEVYRYLSSKDGAMYTTIGNIVTLSSFIEGYINNEYLQTLTEVYPEMLKERTLAFEEKMKKEMEPLQKELEKAIQRGDKKNEKYLKDKINKKLETLKLIGTEKRIKDILTGYAGDSNGMDFWVQGASMSGDVLINQLDEFIKSCVLNNYEDYQELYKQVGEQVNKFEKASGRSKNNPDEFNKNIIEEATIVESIDENNKPVTYKRKKLVDDFDPQYIYDLSFLEAKIENAKKKEMLETDPVKREKLNKEKQALITELYKFTRENFELQTTDEYNEVVALLDEDLGEGVTARETTKDLYHRMRLKQNEIRRTSNIDMLEQLYDNYLELLRELKNYKSEYNKTGTALLVAKQLKNYSKLMRDKAEFVLTEESLADHKKHLLELERSLNAKEITEEEYKYKVEKSYELTPTKEYIELRKDIIEQIKTLAERQSLEILGGNSILKENVAKLYEEMEDAVSKLRDDTGEIEIEDITDPETIALINYIREREDKIIEYKKQLIKISGFSEEDLNRKKELRELFKYADTKEERELISLEIEAINKNAYKNSLDPSSKETLSELISMLQELTSTETTSYYQERLEEQINMIKPTIENFDKSSQFIDSLGMSYSFNEETETWISENGEEKDDVEINSLYKDSIASEKVKDTEWFKKNHIRKKIFNKGGGLIIIDDPIYIWKITRPKEDMYLERIPAFRFRERVINPKYKTNAETIDGKPLPKKNGKYKRKTVLTKVEKEYLDFLTSLHIGNQKKIPLGKRIGSFLPSIPKEGFEKAITTTPEKIGDTIRGVWNWAVRSVKGTEQDKDYLSGKLYDNVLGGIPLLFTGKIDAENQTSDAAYAILHFAGHIIKYNALKKAIPLAAGTSKVLANPKNRPIRPEKMKLLERSADPAAFAMTLTGEDRIKTQSIREKHVNSIINRAFFGQHQYQEEVGGVNIGKIANETMSIAAYQILGGKVVANIKNNISGKIQMFLAARMLSNKIYNLKNLSYGQSMSFGVMTEMLNDRYSGGHLGLKQQLLNKVNAFQGEFYNEFGRKVSATLLKDATNFRNLFMIPKNAAEIEMQIVNALAVFDAISIEHEGKMIPLHQAFVLENGVITGLKGIDPEKLNSAVEQARRDIAYANIVTNGNFDKMNSTEAEKYSMGRLLLFLNKYFIPMFMFKYADRTYNASINEITTGYQREFFMTFLNDARHGYFSFARMITNPDQYSVEEKNAALTVAYELGILMLLGMAYSLLGGKEPDKYKKLKEDPNGYWRAQLLNLILSIKLETETIHPLYGIDNVTQKLKSPFPVARLFENIVKFAYTLDFGDEDFYKRDTGMYKKGQSRAIAYILKLTTLEGMLLELKNPIERLKRTEESQFIKQ